MSYNKIGFLSGQILKASDLNHMEDGIIKALPLSGGTMTGALILDDDPISNFHAATKKYVDDSVKNISLTPGEKGETGDKGEPGVKGDKGEDGKDGISPTVDVEAISGGHRVSITDVNGTKSFSVMDGADGSDGDCSDAAPAIHADQHHSSDTLTWDGDETGRTVVGNGEEVYVHLSDVVITQADITNGVFNVVAVEQDGEILEFYESRWYNYELFPPNISNDIVLLGNAFVIPSDGYVFIDYTFPKKGVYFCKFKAINGRINYLTRLTIPGYTFVGGSDPITHDMIGAAPAFHAVSHYSNDTLVWDGNFTGRTVVVDPDGVYYVHMSSATMNVLQFRDRAFFTTDLFYYAPQIIDDSLIYQFDESPDVFQCGGVFVVAKDNVTVEGITFPKKGIYFSAYYDEDGSVISRTVSLTIPGRHFYDETDALRPEMIGAPSLKNMADVINTLKALTGE